MSKYPLFYNKKPINLVEKFKRIKLSGKVKSRSSYINGIDGVIFKREENEFSLEFDEFKLRTNGKHYKLGILIKNGSFVSENYSLKFENLFLGTFTKGGISEFYETKFSKNKNQYFKLIIPLKNKINFHYQLAPFFYSDEYCTWSRTGFCVELENEQIFVLQKDIKKGNISKNYLIFESNKKQKFEEFSKKIFALRVSLGYIIGDFAGEKGYYFSYNDIERKEIKSFSFHTQRGEIKNFYQPINSNAYAWLHSKNRKTVESIYKKKQLRTLTKEEFSTLVKSCLEQENFLGIILLMIESGKNSLLISPITYLVALEQLGNILVKEKAMPPINNKEDSDFLKNQLLDTLNKFENENIEKNYNLIPARKKIENINQTTNNDKLKLCFQKFQIELLDDDLKIISSRNLFMHGNFPNYRNKKNRTIKEKDLDLYYTSIRIYTLLNMIILKYIGYDNYVINFSKIYEKNTGYLIKEDYYRKV